MSGARAALVYCPFPDRDTARIAANALLDEKLIACGNILGEIESIFDWDGSRGNEKEVAVLFKSSASRLDELITRLGELHPYDAPAILGWYCDAAHPLTIDWLEQQLARGG